MVVNIEKTKNNSTFAILNESTKQRIFKMNTQKTAAVVAAYGVILALLGVAYALLVELALIEVLICLISGIGIGIISHFMLKRQGWAFWAGLGLSFATMLIAGWRSILSLYLLVDALQNDPIGRLYDEAAAVFILFTVFLISMIAGVFQVMLARSNAKELTS